MLGGLCSSALEAAAALRRAREGGEGREFEREGERERERALLRLREGRKRRRMEGSLER